MIKPQENKQRGPIPLGQLDDATREALTKALTDRGRVSFLLPEKLPRIIKYTLPIFAMALASCAPVIATPKPEQTPIVKPIPISPPSTLTPTPPPPADTPTSTATALATATNTPPPPTAPATLTRIATASPSPTLVEQLLGKDPEIAKIIREKSFLPADKIIDLKKPADYGDGNQTVTHAVIRGARRENGQLLYHFQFMLNGKLYDFETKDARTLTFIVADERRDVGVLIPGTVVGIIISNKEYTQLIEGKTQTVNLQGGLVKDIRALDSSWFVTIPIPGTPIP